MAFTLSSVKNITARNPQTDTRPTGRFQGTRCCDPSRKPALFRLHCLYDLFPILAHLRRQLDEILSFLPGLAPLAHA